MQLSSQLFRVEAGTPAALFDDMLRRGFSDGLPMLPPTVQAVEAMLAASGLAPDAVLAVVAPDNIGVTAEKAAINAVMAGCLPEHFPIVVAALQAVAVPEYNLLGVQTTTNPATPVLVVNGPVRERAQVNSRRGCMGPGWRANATIGRALRLILVNCGGCAPGDVDKATHGMPAKFSFCFAEAEEDSPWAPLHVEHGFAPEQSTVAAFAGTGTTNILAFYRSPEAILHVTADAMRCYGSNGYLRELGNPLIVMTPGHARIFAEHGFDKARVQRELFERAQIPRSQVPVDSFELTPAYQDYPPERMIKPCARPEDLKIVVAGGDEAYHIVYIPPFAITTFQIAAVAHPPRSTA
ncbi:hypothetical protein [Xenophilus azovorans]|uniref:hypothetical protein n=1 Tax=Xenophilus azovorans TaxID=151755 RepID=UPI00056DB7B8|nr:hypothetical protein [Xenophilus azovorans]